MGSSQREWRNKIKYKDERSKKRQFSYDEVERNYNNKNYRKWVKGRIKAYDYDLIKKWKKSTCFTISWKY